MLRFSFAKRTAVFALLVATAGLGLGLAIWGSSLAGSDPLPRNRPEFSSDEERQQAALEIHTGSQERDEAAAFRQRFIDSGEDLSTLPVGNISAQYFGPRNLAEALDAAAGGVVFATVLTQEIKEGYVLSHMRRDQQVRGETSDTFTVWQVGGPVEDATGAVAAQLEADPLLVRGRTYVLFLGPCAPTVPGSGTGLWCTGGARGTQFELRTDNTIDSRAPEGAWTTSYNFLPVAKLIDDINSR